MRYLFNNSWVLLKRTVSNLWRRLAELFKRQPTISIDANIVSHLTRTDNGYPVVETMQMIESTRKWWKRVKNGKLFISELALEQISDGEAVSAQIRKDFVAGIEVLDDDDRVTTLTEALEKEKIFSKRNISDAQILANACVNEIEYLVTTNMDDLVKKNNKEAMVQVIEKAGYSPPIIITPADFLIDVLGVTNFATSDRQFNDA